MGTVPEILLTALLCLCALRMEQAPRACCCCLCRRDSKYDAPGATTPPVLKTAGSIAFAPNSETLESFLLTGLEGPQCRALPLLCVRILGAQNLFSFCFPECGGVWCVWLTQWLLPPSAAQTQADLSPPPSRPRAVGMTAAKWNFCGWKALGGSL